MSVLRFRKLLIIVSRFRFRFSYRIEFRFVQHWFIPPNILKEPLKSVGEVLEISKAGLENRDILAYCMVS